MRKILILLPFVLMSGLSGEPVSVIEGDDITLQTGLIELLMDDTLVWMFEPKDIFISQIEKKGEFPSLSFTDDVEFSGRLQVDQKTGSLTIRNTRIRHSGQYKLTISRKKITTKIFNVTVSDVAGETDVKSKLVSALEGELVTLKAEAVIHKDALILWRFGDNGVLLAKIDTETNETTLNNKDESFKNRIQFSQNRSLIIKNTKTTDSGLYELQIRGSESFVKRFFVSISSPGMSPGAKAGIAVVVLLLLVAAAIAIFYYRQRSLKLKEELKNNEEKREVLEGHNLTLKTDTERHHDDKIEWLHGAQETVIAEMDAENCTIGIGTDGRFSSKLKMNEHGDLTISNIRNIHCGLYELKISRGNKIKKRKRFLVTVSVKTKTVKIGESVTLDTKVEVKADGLILWTFGAENLLVIKKNGSTEDVFNERFAGRLTLNNNTASLTIANMTTADSGHFKLQVINSEHTIFRRFNVTVTENPVNESGDAEQLLLNDEQEETNSL